MAVTNAVGRQPTTRGQGSQPTHSASQGAAVRVRLLTTYRQGHALGRGEADANSDVDIAAEIEPAARLDLVGLVSVERRLTEWLGRKVELLPEPVEQSRLQAAIERDRRRAF